MNLRRFFRSTFSFAWTMTVFGTRSLAGLFLPGEGGRRSREAMDAVADAAGEQIDGPLKGLYLAGGLLQDELFDSCAPALDPSRFVVLGDGLAAGMGHFRLEENSQAFAFPTLLARAMESRPFRAPYFQLPGLGDVIGLEPQKPVVPDVRQSTVLRELPRDSTPGNFAVPGFGVDDALDRRPRAPLVDRTSNLQTLTNFILGLPDLGRDPGPGPTQTERALQQDPTLALVSLGYDSVLRAAVDGDLSRLPDAARFGDQMQRLLGELATVPTVLVTTVPDPMKSAYFSSPAVAAEILKTTPSFLAEHYAIRRDDAIHLRGLYAMGYQLMGRKVGPLEEKPAIDRETARRISAAVDGLNRRLRRAAKQTGARVLDLHGFLADLDGRSVTVGAKILHTNYLGGLYLLNGSYPGATLSAMIADWILDELKRRFYTRSPKVSEAKISVEAVAENDANTLSELAPGEPSTDAFLRPRSADEIPGIRPLPGPVQEIPIQTTYPHLQPGKQGCVPAVGIPAAGLADPSFARPDFKPLVVPEEGLEYTLDINPELSYFGDALRAVDNPDEPPLIPNLPPFGIRENVFYGGFMPTTSPLRGKIHLRIHPPQDGVSRFELSHPGGLDGEEGDLVAPQLFKMPVQHTRVQDVPGLVSSGELHLATGRVHNFHYNLQNMNTALYSLLRLNPGPALPALEAALLTFPGLPNGGSSWIRFLPRSDGKFDVSAAAHMFVPFGLTAQNGPVRFALPFTTPDLGAASFVARGTSLHPRIFVTTEPTPRAEPSRAPSIPLNTVQEFTSFSYNTCFGDAFDLHATELGAGGATGRTQLMSRIRVQFGAATGRTVPVVLQVMPPGGLLNGAPTPPPFLPPGLARGEIGFDTVMHFPKQTYPQSGLASPDDPFNICAGSVHLDSGLLVAPLLWRGYVVQALFAALIQVEPCTPADSFNYQGEARFERGAGDEMLLRWNGTVFLPYPTGFKFPAPEPGTPPFTIRADSRLDPFRNVRAASGRPGTSHDGEMRGEVERARSPATGAEFSYRYAIPVDPTRAGEAIFEYVDHREDATFRLHSLTWTDFACSRGSSGERPDTVTFSGFGTWSKDPTGAPHQVSVQISTAPDAPYVGILVDGGTTSNVDIKPHKVAPA